MVNTGLKKLFKGYIANIASAGLAGSVFVLGISSASAAALSGNIEGVLDASGSPYQVISNLTVASGKTLTIQPGVVLLINPGVGVTVNGALITAGTQAEPVIITSSQDGEAGGSGAGAGGQWGVLQFTNSSGAQLANTIVRFGQKVGLTNSSPQFNNVTVATMSVAAITADLTSFPSGAGNSSFGSPVNGIDLPSGGVSQNNTWGLVGIPYIIRSGDVSVGISGSRLTIAPGVIIKLLNSRLQNIGALTAVGTAEAPIVFTSYYDDTVGGDSNQDNGVTAPGRGNWRDVQLAGAGTSGSRLEH
ncbi:MAG TPA: hypothetical protein DCZ93_08215, partial [Elusimicrobia bacterium]|nr:hypothetical protein [Elusimicrobiota bacterium]